MNPKMIPHSDAIKLLFMAQNQGVRVRFDDDGCYVVESLPEKAWKWRTVKTFDGFQLARADFFERLEKIG